MAYSNDELQGKEMHVDDHPADNIEHPEPGPRVKIAGDVIDKSSQFSDLKTLNGMIHNLSETTGVKRPGTPDTPATVIKLPAVRNK